MCKTMEKSKVFVSYARKDTEQVRRYATDRKVAVMAQGTQLHLIRLQLRSVELLRVEEVGL